MGSVVDDEGRSIAADTRETVAHRLGATVPTHDLTATVGPSDPGLAETRDSLVPGRHDQHDQPALPDRLGRYVVLSQLGVGGMGVVYKAYDPELDRRVALKLLLGPASGMAAARLKREAQAMARLSHSNVVPIFDVGEVGGRLFVAMDLIDGTTLSEWMKLSHTWREVLDLFVQAGRGLAAAHAAGLTHRDFKPETWSPPWTAPLPPSGRILKNRGDLREGHRRWAPRGAAVLATGWQRAERYCSST